MPRRNPQKGRAIAMLGGMEPEQIAQLLPGVTVKLVRRWRWELGIKSRRQRLRELAALQRPREGRQG